MLRFQGGIAERDTIFRFLKEISTMEIRGGLRSEDSADRTALFIPALWIITHCNLNRLQPFSSLRQVEANRSPNYEMILLLSHLYHLSRYDEPVYDCE